MASRTSALSAIVKPGWQHVDAFTAPQPGAQVHERAVDAFEAREIGPFLGVAFDDVGDSAIAHDYAAVAQ